jgi:hypothetical protein
MIQIELQPEIQDRLAAQAKARGIALSEFVHELLLSQSERLPERGRARSVSDAVDHIRALREGNLLGDIRIRELIDEGRKY